MNLAQTHKLGLDQPISTPSKAGLVALTGKKRRNDICQQPDSINLPFLPNFQT